MYLLWKVVVAHTSTVLLVPLSTTQRRVALLQLVAGTDPRLVPKEVRFDFFENIQILPAGAAVLLLAASSLG